MTEEGEKTSCVQKIQLSLYLLFTLSLIDLHEEAHSTKVAS